MDRWNHRNIDIWCRMKLVPAAASGYLLLQQGGWIPSIWVLLHLWASQSSHWVPGERNSLVVLSSWRSALRSDQVYNELCLTLQNGWEKYQIMYIFNPSKASSKINCRPNSYFSEIRSIIIVTIWFQIGECITIRRNGQTCSAVPTENCSGLSKHQGCRGQPAGSSWGDYSVLCV